MVTAAMKLKDFLGRKAMTYLEYIQKQRYHFADKGPYSQSYVFFQESRTDVKVGPKRKLSTKELMLLNCGAGKDS